MNSNSNRSSLSERSASALLAAASAGLLSQSVSGSPYTEGSDFPDDSAHPAVLPIGTDVVFGTIFSPDVGDAFEIDSLVGGAVVELKTHLTLGGGGGINLYVYDSSATQLYYNFFTSSADDVTSLTIPNDGKLTFYLTVEGGSGASYSVTIPEASTAGAVAGLAALLELRRRRAAETKRLRD